MNGRSNGGKVRQANFIDLKDDLLQVIPAFRQDSYSLLKKSVFQRLETVYGF